MANDLEISSGNSQVALREKEIAGRVRQVEKGGYYKNVVSPDEYLKKKSKEINRDLEITDDEPQQQQRGSKEKKVEPLKHWKDTIQREFEKCTEAQKDAWLGSFKIVEKNFMKQLNELKDEVEFARPAAELVADLSQNHAKELASVGKTPAQYLKTLVDFDKAIGKNPAYEIAKLILIFNVQYQDIYNNISPASQDLANEAHLTKMVAPLQQEISQLKSALGYAGHTPESNEEAERKAKLIVEEVKMFFSQRDAKGELLYPNAMANIDDIFELVQTGETLDDAYHLVMNGKTRSQTSSDDAIDYDEPQGRKQVQKTALELEKEMLRNSFKKLMR
jgi:hypothetical protein